MEHRVLGKTGLKVSVISFGAAPLGGEYRRIDEAEGIQSLHLALDLGVNLAPLGHGEYNRLGFSILPR